MRLQNHRLRDVLIELSEEALLNLFLVISDILRDPIRPSVNLAGGNLKNQSLCLVSAMSKDQSGVAELLSAKHGAIRASVFRHSRHMAPQVRFHCVSERTLTEADGLPLNICDCKSCNQEWL